MRLKIYRDNLKRKKVIIVLVNGIYSLVEILSDVVEFEVVDMQTHSFFQRGYAGMAHLCLVRGHEFSFVIRSRLIGSKLICCLLDVRLRVPVYVKPICALILEE